MKSRIRKGFSLIELVLATLMFGFMMMSLASIYSTANKHMFQNYRQNIIKSNASMAMKTITTSLSGANRVDAPAIGGQGNSLRFAVNVDQSGCYPVNPALPASWHEVCLYTAAPNFVTPVACPSGRCLYYHTGTIPVNAGTNPGCPDGPTLSPVYPGPLGLCGISMGTITQLAAFVQPQSGDSIFYRSAVTGRTVVNIKLRTFWDPAAAANIAAGHNFSTTAKTIDATLNTSVRVGRSGQ